jgi:hypothetical protein
MSFEDLLKYKPKTPFQVIEKDLSLEPDLKRKTYFTNEDMKIDHSNERLQKGEIIIPIFKDTTIRPLAFKGKFMSCETENMGAGFYKITHKRGRVKPKPNDRRYAQEEIDRGGLLTFYIAYDRETDTYKYIEKEKKFLQMYQEIADIKNNSEVQHLINDFINWIQFFWTPAFREKHHFGTVTSNQTYLDYLKIISLLKKEIPMIKSYHLLLNIFGDICDKTYAFILNSLTVLERHMKRAEDHIESYFPDTRVVINHLSDSTHGKPLLDFLGYMQHYITERGYFVDPIEKKAYPNLAEVFHGEQFTHEFVSNNSKNQHVSGLLKKALENKNTFFLYSST